MTDKFVISNFAGTQRSQILITPADFVGPPTATTHKRGELHQDANLDIYQCTASGTPGSWSVFNPAGNSNARIDVYRSIDTSSFTTSDVAIAWNVVREQTAESSFTSGDDEIVVVDAGLYKAEYSVAIDILTGNNRSSSEAELQLDTGSGFAVVPGTRRACYNREINEGATTASASPILNLNAGDKIRVVVRRTSGGSTLVVRGQQASLQLFAFGRGPKGDKGDPGAGSTINVLSNGSPTSNSPVSELNFVGFSVSEPTADRVAILSPNQDTLQLAFYGEQEAELTQSTTSFQPAFSDSFVAEDADYMVEWSYEHRAAANDNRVGTELTVGGTLVAAPSENPSTFFGGFTTAYGPVAGHKRLTLSAGTTNILFRYRSDNGGALVGVRRFRIKVYKVS